MMGIALFLLSWMFITIIYYLGTWALAIRWRIHDSHYFIGYKPRLFDFHFRNIRFSVGLYLPLAGLFRMYRIENGERKRLRYYWEYFDQPLVKRFFVTTGCLFSLMMASALIFITLTFFEERWYISKSEVLKYGIYPSELAETNGLQRGDKILLINGKEYDDFLDLTDPNILFKRGNSYTVLREGREMILPLQEVDPDKFEMENIPYISLLAPFEVIDVVPGSPADDAGLVTGDLITKVNGDPKINIYDFKRKLRDNKGVVTLEVTKTQGGSEPVKISLVVKDDYYTGMQFKENINYVVKRNSVFEAIQKGVTKPFHILKSQVDAFFTILSGDLHYQKRVTGPVAMTSVFDSGYQWKRFWTITGLLSVMTVFMNLLPLPNTVFWKIIPLGFEALTGRTYSYTIYRATRIAGFIVMIILMMLILVNDVMKVL